MNARRDSAGAWLTNTPSFTATLPILVFPFDQLPEVFAPERTLLTLGSEYRSHTYLWCYLRRKSVGGSVISFDGSSLSAARVAAMPAALERLSKMFRHAAARPARIHGQLKALAQFLTWADGPEHEGRYETVLTDPVLALEALRRHHSFLRSCMQSHRLTDTTAAGRDQGAIGLLSAIQVRDFADDIEALSARKDQLRGTKAPREDEVQAFISRSQAVFDSASKLLLNEEPLIPSVARRLRLSSVDDADTVTLPETYPQERLMELACLAFVALFIADSGVNLAVIQDYEEPDDLLDQLAHPEKVNLRDRAIKFRAGGKLVPVHLSALTTTRLRVFLRVRQVFVASMGGEDPLPLFVQGSYRGVTGLTQRPAAVRAIHRQLLTHLRSKFSTVGADLPSVTLRQLRVYKQQHLVRHHPLNVASEMMGHTVETAVRVYSKAQEGLREAEMGRFFESLERTVLAASDDVSQATPTEVLPTGACADYGKPAPSASALPVQPDCAKVEGCFFCSNYRLHADERDLRKLMSCRVALKRLAPLQPDSARAERVYVAIVDRIDFLLSEIRRLVPEVYEEARADVNDRGNLTTYWSSKLQQLHLLGMLSASP